MAENLACLPSVSPPEYQTDISKRYYVYDYDYVYMSVSEAKGTVNFSTYGMLYNWIAAKTACPSGRHLPTDAEWKIFEVNPGMT